MTAKSSGGSSVITIFDHFKHREFTSLHKAWNTRPDSDLYHRRKMNETVNAAINQKFGAFVRSRLWWKQYRELLVKCVVHNLERGLAISHEGGECLWFREVRAAEDRGYVRQEAVFVLLHKEYAGFDRAEMNGTKEKIRWLCAKFHG